MDSAAIRCERSQSRQSMFQTASSHSQSVSTRSVSADHLHLPTLSILPHARSFPQQTPAVARSLSFIPQTTGHLPLSQPPISPDRTSPPRPGSSEVAREEIEDDPGEPGGRPGWSGCAGRAGARYISGPDSAWTAMVSCLWTARSSSAIRELSYGKRGPLSAGRRPVDRAASASARVCPTRSKGSAGEGGWSCPDERDAGKALVSRESSRHE